MRGLRLSSTINASIQNEMNKSIIFHYLCAHEGVYKAKIAEELGISAPAVSRVIRSLIEDEFIVETEGEPGRQGRKVARLNVNARRGIVIGIDLIKERTKMGVSDFSGTLIEKYSGFQFSASTAVEKELIAEVDHILESPRHPRAGPEGNLLAICIGIPAATSNALYPTMTTPLYRGLEGLNLSATLEARYKVPVYVENVVKLSALAEMNFGVAQRYSDIAFVEVSNGIGAGIIIDGHLYRGANGASGELGFTLLGIEGLKYRASTKGQLEYIASIEGMTRAAREGAATNARTLMLGMANGRVGEITASIVCDAALRGDDLARRIVGQTVESLSVGIINMILVLNPQKVVLGGDLCRLPGLRPLFLDPIRGNAERSIPFKVPEIALSSLGEDAGLLGASYFAINSLLSRRFPYKLGDAHSGMAGRED